MRRLLPFTVFFALALCLAPVVPSFAGGMRRMDAPRGDDALAVRTIYLGLSGVT